MPIYTYECLKCSWAGERTSHIVERDYQVCPECGLPLKRLIDRPGLVWAPTSTNGGMKA